jgi:hypothetical protein
MSATPYIPPGSRIVLVQPPLRDFYLTRHRMNVLGLELVKSMLEKAGYTLEILNFPRGGEVKNLPLPESLAHLTPFLIPGEKGPLSGFPRFRRFGLDFAGAAARILSLEPNLILIGLFAWAYGQDAMEMAEVLRTMAPGAVIGIGGAGLTVDTERFEKAGLFDLLLAGEAERVLPEWIAAGAPAKGVFRAEPPVVRGNGISAADRKEAVQTGEPEPAVAWVPEEAALSLSLSRGCPMRCSFCANRLVHGTLFRTVPVKKILSAIDRCLFSSDREEGFSGGYEGVKRIYFEDDNLSADPEWFARLMHALADRFPGVVMSAENGIDYRFLDSEKLELLFHAGFRRLNLSLASTDTEQLKRQGRPGRLGRYLELLHLAEGLGMEAVTYFIAGLPGEKPEAAVRNLRFLQALPTDAGISLYYPVPGIGGFEDPSKFRGVPFQRALGSAAWPWGGGFTTAQLLTAFRLARLSNLLKKASLSGEERKLLETVLRTGRLHTWVGRRRELREVVWADRRMLESFLA